ncbi:MAG: single-stranded DNA-binding protein [Proteobacteria bacterium]|nr:single-stranded DNA-binding protein [Pseudomonadota bacterium]MBU1057583.1 single-stranded DNA-binding protein [Pseudomonadota bacterium]
MNKAMIIGNLGNDPELRYTQNQTPVATFSVASTERWKDFDGNKQEHTEWHRVVVWKGLAEVCNEHLSKGSKVFIEGKLRTRKWEDQDGNIRYSTEIIARDLEMLGGRQENSESVPDDGRDAPLPENDIPF